jgi:signal transduction histidine kinase
MTLDLAAAIACTAVLYGGFVEAGYRPAMCLLLAVPAALPALLWRRFEPATILGAVLVIPAVTVGVAGNLVSWLFLPTAFALYLVATGSHRRTSVVMVCAVLAVLTADGLAVRLRGRPANAETVSIAMMLVIAWGVGHLVRQRRTTAARQRAQATEHAAAEERLRIAREMHDVLAHSMSVIAVQASFGHYVIDSRPDEAATALGLIETTSREALAEIRDLLGVLRRHETGPNDSANGKAGAAPLGPAPGLAELDHLLARTAEAGVDADIEVRGEARTLPPGLELSIHRIVQEALTNVVKHSAAEQCRIVLEYRHDELLLDITDDGPADTADAPAGHGLIGMRERVDLHRGRFAAGPLPGGGFQVTARIPLREGPR